MKLLFFILLFLSSSLYSQFKISNKDEETKDLIISNLNKIHSDSKTKSYSGEVRLLNGYYLKYLPESTLINKLIIEKINNNSFRWIIFGRYYSDNIIYIKTFTLKENKVNEDIKIFVNNEKKYEFSK